MKLLNEYNAVIYKNKEDYHTNRGYYMGDGLLHLVQVDVDPFTLWIIKPYPRNMTTETFDWTVDGYKELKDDYSSVRYEQGERKINDDPTWRAVDRGAFKLTAHRLVMDDTDAVKFKLIHGSHD
jgi:hypothetical protein